MELRRGVARQRKVKLGVMTSCRLVRAPLVRADHLLVVRPDIDRESPDVERRNSLQGGGLEDSPDRDDFPHRLELHPDRDSARGVIGPVLRDVAAAADARLQQADVLEAPQRFAEHAPRQAELGGQLPFGRKAIARFQCPVEDHRGNTSGRRVDEREGFYVRLGGPVVARLRPLLAFLIDQPTHLPPGARLL